MNFTAAGQSNSKEVDESIFQYICCLLLRHITQLVCNGHAIYDVGACDTGMYVNFAKQFLHENLFEISSWRKFFSRKKELNF